MCNNNRGCCDLENPFKLEFPKKEYQNWGRGFDGRLPKYTSEDMQKRPWRICAVCQTDKDLDKSIQQLMCDLHEEIFRARHDWSKMVVDSQPSTPVRSVLMPRSIVENQIKRLGALIGRTALEHEHSSKVMEIISRQIYKLTIYILILTGISTLASLGPLFRWLFTQVNCS